MKIPHNPRLFSIEVKVGNAWHRLSCYHIGFAAYSDQFKAYRDLKQLDDTELRVLEITKAANQTTIEYTQPTIH